MKQAERTEARRLRGLGCTVPVIAAQLGVAKSTASLWLRDIPLSEVTLAHLASTRRSRIGHGVRNRKVVRWAGYRKEAEEQWLLYQSDPAFLFAIGLYAGEGSKTGSALAFSNSNPRLVACWKRFLGGLGVERSRMRLHVQIPVTSDCNKARDHWIAALSIAQEHVRVYPFTTPCSKQARGNSRPNGTASLRVNDTRLLVMVLHWVDLASGSNSVE